MVVGWRQRTISNLQTDLVFELTNIDFVGSIHFPLPSCIRSSEEKVSQCKVASGEPLFFASFSVVASLHNE